MRTIEIGCFVAFLAALAATPATSQTAFDITQGVSEVTSANTIYALTGQGTPVAPSRQPKPFTDRVISRSGGTPATTATATDPNVLIVVSCTPLSACQGLAATSE